MKKILPLAVLLLASLGVVAQKSNDQIQRQIKSLHADKSITLTYDGNSSKVMATAPNFSDADTKAAGVQAMNFGMAFFYPGQQLTSPPDTINFTFWVLTKKPRFAPSGKWVAMLGSETLDLGDYRYTAKPSEDMEYLNFRIKRDDLAKIAAGKAPLKFTLGQFTLSFTAEQVKLLNDFLALSANN